MEKLERQVMRRRGKTPASGFFVVLAAMLVLSGCSSVPDYANPVEWYNSTVDFFDDDAPPPLPAEEVPGANEPFPELANTPETPLRVIELGTLDQVGEGLIADRANARYTDEAIRAGDETTLVEPPTYQAEAPVLPTLQPAPQPSAAAPALPAAPQPALLQSTALQPAPPQYTPPQSTPLQSTGQPTGTGRGIDVRSMFASLFTSSGPRGVAPALSNAAPSTPLPGSSSLISWGGGLVYGGGSLFGSNKAAVIYFALGSARIGKQGRDALHKLADYHKQSGGTLRVVGHASNRTKELSPERHELVNFDISFKRARAVADELIRRGVAPDKLKVIAMSHNAPVYREWMPSGEAGNRRAEVYIDF